MKLKDVLKKLNSGECPPGVKLDIWGYDIGYEDAQALAEAFESGKCPLGLNLMLTSNYNDTSSTKALA